MILFFHIICLLAQYIISNFSKSISKCKLKSEDENEEENDKSQSSMIIHSANGSVKEPIYKDGTLTFFPPVYVQRYEIAALILQEPNLKGKIHKVADFGCAELGFFLYLKNIEGINEILEIDIDEEILQRNACKAAPLTSQFLINKAIQPLDVYILAGSIDKFDDHLLGTDVVIGIELIEHLSEETLENMPHNVFHEIRPKLAIFTTPNADFNSLFPNIKDYRHSSHRFEWSRKEFFNWTQEIIKNYPEYSVRFFGIGAGPQGTENLGCCSQMVVFQRGDRDQFESPREPTGIHNYKLIKHYSYPVYEDLRSREQKIFQEVQYQVAHIVPLPEYYNFDNNESEIPVSVLKKYVSELCPDEEELRIILSNFGMKVEQRNGEWLLIYSESDFNVSDVTCKDEEWLHEDIVDDQLIKIDSVFNENWDWNDDVLQPDDVNDFHTARSLANLEAETTISKPRLDILKCIKLENLREESRSAPQSCDRLEKIGEYRIPEDTELSETPGTKYSQKTKKYCGKSKIPRKTFGRDLNVLNFTVGYNDKSYVCKKRGQMFRSCSLDSCLENINCKPPEFESYYLNLIPGGSVSLRNISPLSRNKHKHIMNDSGSSLFSSSIDKAVDSGYPFSFSPPDADLTPEQVDELFTEMMSRSTSASSEKEMIDPVNRVIQQDLFVDDLVVENGDLVNNNRDGEGNNVEGLIGQRLANELAERDPNDNMMFFPDIEEFPHWLLNLVELAQRPVFIPINGLGYNDDEGVGDDSSSDFNQSLDPEDLDFYVKNLELS